MTKQEPTITEVMGVVNGLAMSVQDLTEAVQTGFQKMEERFEKVDERFNEMEERFEKVDERFDEMEERFEKNNVAHTALFEGQRQILELLNERTTTIDKRLTKTQSRVEDVVDVLEKAAKKMPRFDVTQLLYEDK